MPSGGKGRHEYRVVAAEVEERHGFVVALLELEKKIDAEREDVHEVDVHFRDVTRHCLQIISSLMGNVSSRMMMVGSITLT